MVFTLNLRLRGGNMKRIFSIPVLFLIALAFVGASQLKAQTNVLSQDFQGYSAGDSLPAVAWSPSDIQSKIVDSSGNKVLQNTVNNYGAAPILKFVLPAGKTLANYGSLTFKGYFAQGDVAYKGIVVQAHQTMPTGPAFQDTLGIWNRAQMGSTAWENISVNIANSSSLHDTIYVDFGINCAGTGNVGGTGVTTIWYADDVALVAKADTTPPPAGPIVTNGDFELSNVGIVDTSNVKGWVIQVADTVNPKPVFQIVSDTVEHGSRALKVTVHGLGVNQWDVQIVADSLHVTPGIPYNYSVWAKSDVAGATVNFTTWSQAGGEYKAIRPATLSTKWQNFTMQFTVTDASSIIRAPIHFYGTPDVGNNIYIDNLQITQVIQNPVDSSKIWKGPALAAGSPKFLGSAGDSPASNFASYWTQLTPENAGKWGSVGTSTDTTQWNWTGLDNDYNYAKRQGLIFKDHNLIWGAQQPSWISSLDSATQYHYIQTWIRQVGQRYPNMDMIDVVNEPLAGHTPPDGGISYGSTVPRANYINALGGTGATGIDWIITAFELARQYIPHTKLLINDYGILNSNSNTTSYIQIINLLKDRGLIDGIGCQAHGFESTSAATIQSNLDRLAATGLPIYISEFDLNIQDDTQQKTKYQELFPVMWQHPDVKGVTLWGYIQGRTWLTNSYLVNTDGTARPALLWLADYIKNNPLGVAKSVSGVPTRFQLAQNFPNPFNPTSEIQYSVPRSGHLSLKVYNILGEEVVTLFDGVRQPGNYVATFNGTGLASGVYFYRLQAGNFTQTKKLMLVK